MNLRFSILFTLLYLFISLANGTNLGFAVVAPGASSVQVSIGGTNYDLTTPFQGIAYYTGVIDVSDTGSFAYHYIVDGIAESFDKSFPSPRTKTYNDFYGRKDTIRELDQLGSPYPKWTRSLGPNGVFDDDYISTILFVGSTAESFFSNQGKNGNADGAISLMINKDDVNYATDTKIYGKNGLENKIEIYLAYKTQYHGRSNYKFRPSTSDPVFFREKLYNDVLEALGAPHEESSFIRVYVADKGMGLYHLQEYTATWDFARTQFNGHQWADVGVIYDCSTGADFAPGSAVNSFQTSGSKDPISGAIAALAALDPTSDSQIADFNDKWFDVDTFLKAMFLEYYAGHTDSYWYFTSNFVVYQDPSQSNPPNTYKLFFIDQDFDMTFGVNYPTTEYGHDWKTQPYSNLVDRQWTDGATHRTMIDKLLANPSTKNKFEDIIKTATQSITNPIALGKRIDDIVLRITDDITWDRSLGSNRYRVVPTASAYANYSVSDFTKGITTAVHGNDGLKDMITIRSDYLASAFGITYDSTPMAGNTGNEGVSTSGSSYQIPGLQTTTGPASTTASATTTTGPASATTTTGPASATTTTASGSTTSRLTTMSMISLGATAGTTTGSGATTASTSAASSTAAATTTTAAASTDAASTTTASATTGDVAMTSGAMPDLTTSVQDSTSEASQMTTGSVLQSGTPINQEGGASRNVATLFGVVAIVFALL